MRLERSDSKSITPPSYITNNPSTLRFAPCRRSLLPAGCTLYNKATWGWGLSFSEVCAILAALPLAILFPAVPFLYELEGESKSVKEQINDIWQMVQLKAVWKPMAFIYVYNLLQTPNVAWNSYLQLTLKFPAWFIGFIGEIGRGQRAGTKRRRRISFHYN